jgi:O-antigen/teichoic acid export membrane protein
VTEVPASVETSVPAAGGVLGLLRSSAVVGAAIGATYVLNGLFSLVMARVLEPHEYSLMISLFTVILMSNVPTLALQAGVARGMAQRLRSGGEAEAGRLLRAALTGVLRWEALVLALAGAATYPLVRLLHVQHALPPAATAGAVALGFVVPVALGGLQAQQRFAALSFVQLFYAALKFGAGVVFALAFGVSGVMVGIALATAGTVGLALWLLRGTLAAAHGGAGAGRSGLLRDSGLAATAFTLWTCCAYVDQIVARLALPHERAGVFQAASTATRLMFVIPVVATTVLFPRVASLGDALREREHLVLGVRFVSLFAAVGTALAFLVPRQLIELSLGEKYVAAAPWLGWLALTMSLFALGYVYVAHFVALGRTRFPLVLVGGVALELLLFSLLHGSPRQLVAVELASAALLVLASEAYDRVSARG